MSEIRSNQSTDTVEPVSRRAKGLTAAVAGGLAVVAALFCFDPARVPIYPVCPFHQFTGLDCPGCGSLRALHALLHGQWMAALHFNLFFVLSLPFFTWLGFRLAWSQFAGGPPVVIRPAWLWLYAGAWAAFGILRNLPFGFFAPWAP
jgi:Protein of unknown function (DUF2752)